MNAQSASLCSLVATKHIAAGFWMCMSIVNWNNSASFFGSPLTTPPPNKAGWAFPENCLGIKFKLFYFDQFINIVKVKVKSSIWYFARGKVKLSTHILNTNALY